MKCPACDDPVFVEGTVATKGYDSPRFRPSGLRWFVLTNSVHLHATLRACTSCGFVWGSLDPAVLRDLIDRAGSEQLLTTLRLRARTP